MTNLIVQCLSLFGAVLVLVAFAGTQTGRMDPRRLPSGLLNLTGSALLFASAISPPNAGVLVLEGAWALISLASVVRAWSRPPNRDAEPLASSMLAKTWLHSASRGRIARSWPFFQI